MCPFEFHSESTQSALNSAGERSWSQALEEHGFNESSLWDAIDDQFHRDETLAKEPLTPEQENQLFSEEILSTYADNPAFIPEQERETLESRLSHFPKIQSSITDYVKLSHVLRQYFIRQGDQCLIDLDAKQLVDRALTDTEFGQTSLQTASVSSIQNITPFPQWAMAAAAAVSLIVVVGIQQMPSLSMGNQHLASIPSPEAYVLAECESILPEQVDPAWIVYNCTLGI